MSLNIYIKADEIDRQPLNIDTFLMLYCTELVLHDGVDGMGAGVWQSRRSRVYHQGEALYIINSAGIVSHQAADIHAKA